MATLGEVSLDRMVRAVEKVRERLQRCARALQQAGVRFAVAGGNAVAAWVSRVDEAAVRNTRGVDLLVVRDDLAAVRAALEPAGFVYRHVASVDMFLDGPQASARDAVHLVFAGERVREDHPLPAPTIDQRELSAGLPIVTLEALVRMKLTSYRDKDRTHVRDLIDVGLVDESWPSRLPTPLDERLQAILDDPDG